MKKRHAKRSFGHIRETRTGLPRKEGVEYPGAVEIDDEAVHYRIRETDIPLKNGSLKPHGHGPHLDKSMQGWEATAPLSDRKIAATIGNDFSNGNRGMAKAVRGAKKYVRSRVRFHENQAVRKMMRDGFEED